MKWNKMLLVSAVVIALIPLGLYAYYYDQLPAQVATHFDFAGNANGFTRREYLWVPLGLPLGMIPLLVILPRSDPRGKSYQKLGRIYPGFVWGMTVFLTVLMTALLVNGVSAVALPMETLTVVAVGILFLVLGNYLPKMKQSYTLGIKTPWTLDHEVVWNKTHRLAGPCFMVAGMCMCLTPLLPSPWRFAVMMVSIALAAGIPGVMSYVYYRREQWGNNG